MNPFIASIHKRFGKNPSVKKRGDTKSFLINTFIFSILIQTLLFAFVYAFILPILLNTPYIRGFYFRIILVALKIIPRFFGMWMQSIYPITLPIIEFINGTKLAVSLWRSSLPR
jgi:hypothetical protein